MKDIEATDADSGAKELGFGAAMQELEGILRRIENEETDIDELAEELKRAAFLLETCRSKVRRAEVEVSQIVQSLEGSPDAESAVPDAPDEPSPASLGETASLFDTGD